MYFNESSNNTNINTNNQSTENKEKSKLPLIIIGVISILTIFIIAFIFCSNKKNDYTITLIGEESITIYKGDNYIEQGYKAYDKNKNDVTNEVDYKNTVDTSTPGEYQITYSLNGVSVTRYVTVIEKTVGATHIHLKGDLTIYLDINGKYTEPGYLVVDTIDGNLTDKVKITNNVNSSKTGTYNVVYSVVNSSGVTTSATRTVIVMGSEISLSLNTREYTNSPVTINIYVKDNYFNYLILPNGEKINKNSHSYKVSENGTYKFITYNKKGTKKESSITVSNIDKTAPTGSCSGTYKDGKSTIYIKANDNIGINKYVINNTTYTSSFIIINSELKSVNITIYDKAGNTKNISCNLENKNTSSTTDNTDTAKIRLSLSTQNYTNSNLNINVSVDDNNFNYLVLPNGTKITTKTYNYKVSENGTYKFTTYNKKGIKKEASITVSNIDKTSPNGSCSGKYKDGKSTIYIKANDNIGINKYVINNNTYTSSFITINSELKSVNITIYDKAGNTKNISCNLENKNTTSTQITNKPIAPTGSEKIIYQASSSTIDVWIEKKNFYYVSHIWVKDAYNQFKSAVPPQFGNEIMSAGNILKNAISTHNYQSKITIGVNASGFVLNGSYGQSYYDANSAWNMTSLSPIVIVEGKVLRNISSGKIPSNSIVTYGLKKDGTLGYYKYSAGTNLQSNINLSQKIINDGVKDTFAFNQVLVLNGKTVSTSTSPNLRQGICQIDKNNFVFITNVNDTSNRSSGFSFKSLGDYMVSLGCKTGFNLDGGGSTTLMFKNKDADTEIITGNSRKIADIIYFHE